MAGKAKVYYATGRRKTSVARVYIKNGQGAFTVNEKPMVEYFGRKTAQQLVFQPMNITDKAEKLDVSVTVVGGGLSGQAGAVKHGLSRALVKMNGENRKTLKVKGLLTRDDRQVESKKYGRHKARRRPQFSKR